ncbi:MAG: hypothetical protein PHQ76_04535 [Caldisericia bacterium]|nr:hypothetical protein [Caldisericia bacterium]
MPKSTQEEKYRWIKPILDKKLVLRIWFKFALLVKEPSSIGFLNIARMD